MPRKYSNLNIKELENLVSESIGDSVILNAIQKELQHRSSVRAEKLTRFVESALEGSQVAVFQKRNESSQKGIAPAILGGKEIKAKIIRPSQDLIEGLRDAPAKEVFNLLETWQQQLSTLELKVEDASRLEARVHATIEFYNQDLLVHMQSLLPGAFPIQEHWLSNLSNIAKAEFDRLRTIAYQRWPSREKLSQAEAQLSHLKKKHEELRSEFSKKKMEHDALFSFVTKNRINLVAELENEFIKSIAERISFGADDLDLLTEIREADYDDPIAFLARARLYYTNVLKC